MKRLAVIATLMICTSPAFASAQPTMDSLWPNSDGLRFEYLYHRISLMEDVDFTGEAYLGLEGYTTTAGGEAQVLVGEHSQEFFLEKSPTPELPPLLASVWRARPDLRKAVETHCGAKTRNGYWHPTFLHTGYLMKSADKVEMWQDEWSHSTWTYLDGEPVVGSSFTHQLVPELADDIFLHGEVTAVNATVETENGTYHNAVQVTYLVDFGVSTVLDESGVLIATTHSELRGHVHFVPDVGPVEMLQEYLPFIWLECGDDPCPEDLLRWVGQVTETMTLSLQHGPVATEMLNLGSVKALYR